MNPILSLSKSKIKPHEEEIYRALVRNLRMHRGFGILFVCCTPEQEQRIIKQVEEDLPQKKIAVRYRTSYSRSSQLSEGEISR